jgi:gas vesicle protein
MATKKSRYNNNPIGVLLGVLVGGVAGASAMLLFAPQSGKQTRDQIEEKALELRDQTTINIKKAVAQIRSESNKITVEVQDKLVEQLDHVSAALDTGIAAIESA